MVKTTDADKLKLFGSWLALRREQSGFDSQRQLALATGVSPATISRIEAGTQKAEAETLKKLAPHLKVSYEEILAEAGYLSTPSEVGSSTSLVDRFHQLLQQSDSAENVTGLLAELLNLLPNPPKNLTPGERPSNRLPILGTIRAGLPILAYDNWEGEIDVPVHMRGDFVLRVEGDSMLYAGINPGDLAIMKANMQPYHGRIVAAGVEDGEWAAHLKFYVQEGNKIYLRSANPGYEDYEFTPEHRIIGVLVGIIRDSAPTLSDYKNLLRTKEYEDTRWTNIIESAITSGFKPEHLQQLMDMQKAMATQLLMESKRTYK